MGRLHLPAAVLRVDLSFAVATLLSASFDAGLVPLHRAFLWALILLTFRQFDFGSISCALM